MKKLFKHKWENSGKIIKGKLNHKVCTKKCGCEKYFDTDLYQTVYTDIFGRLRFRAPDCVS
jgi:hypothetical protein